MAEYTCPILLQGRKQIAATFLVNPATVTQWVREGAPIWREGNRWQVDYHSLVRWFESHRKIDLDARLSTDTEWEQDENTVRRMGVARSLGRGL